MVSLSPTWCSVVCSRSGRLLTFVKRHLVRYRGTTLSLGVEHKGAVESEGKEVVLVESSTYNNDGDEEETCSDVKLREIMKKNKLLPNGWKCVQRTRMTVYRGKRVPRHDNFYYSPDGHQYRSYKQVFETVIKSKALMMKIRKSKIVKILLSKKTETANIKAKNISIDDKENDKLTMLPSKTTKEIKWTPWIGERVWARWIKSRSKISKVYYGATVQELRGNICSIQYEDGSWDDSIRHVDISLIVHQVIVSLHTSAL